MSTRAPALTLSLTLIAVAPALFARDADVVIDEIHYNPLSIDSLASDEWVELRNLGPQAVDLSGWRVGGGVRFEFPPGATIAPRGWVVVARDPRAASLRALSAPVFGPFEGALSNQGEILTLENRERRPIGRVHYRDEPPWPTAPDGLGPSLELTVDDGGNDLPWRWAASRVLGGTPGRENSRRDGVPAWSPLESRALVAASGSWRLWRGRTAPSTPPPAWTTATFDDASWALLPGPFGFGDEHGLAARTTLDDMWFAYSTVFLRATFTLAPETLERLERGDATLRLRGAYDDGFVAWIGGVEIARDNAGVAGTAVGFDARASSSRTGSEDVAIDALAVPLVAGENLLAIAGLNHGAESPDFFLGLELVLEEAPAPLDDPARERSRVDGVLNEVRAAAGAAGGAGFLELFNPTAATLDLSHHRIVSSHGTSFALGAGVTLAPGEHVVVDEISTGVRFESSHTVWVLVAPDDASIVDALDASTHGGGDSVGRFPDGGEDVFALSLPSPGAVNVHARDDRAVISELYFHPPAVPPSADCERRCSDAFQWLEVHNRSDEWLALDGWSLSKGVRFAFPSTARIAPGGFLVVAADAASFRSRWPGVDDVAGDWDGRLSHASDTVNLRDPRGNRVDHVRYGDGGPTNDEAPADGVDDSTLRASDWPSGADGSGRSLELVHPALDNRAGGSWRASAELGGTPGRENSRHEASPAPVVFDVRHSPATPRSGEPVIVRCRVTRAEQAIELVDVRWSLDVAAAPWRAVPLCDDGVLPDGVALDGEFTGTIPPQPDGAIVRWQIAARDAAGFETLVPAAPDSPPYESFEGPYFLHEIDDTNAPPIGAPVVRIVMSRNDRAQLRNRPVQSDVLLPATLVVDGVVRHRVGVRYRGESSRQEIQRSFRVDLPPEAPLRGTRRLDLNGSNGGVFNSQNVNELLSMDLFRRLGDPYALEEPATLHFRELVFRDFDARFVIKEAYDGDFLARTFDDADSGNLYRARSPEGSGAPSGDLAYRGDDPAAYRALYEKRSNEELDDWSDIVELTRTLDPGATPDEVFRAEFERLADVRQWARFFAAFACVTNADGGIWNQNGEDYWLYRVPRDATTANAGKWLLMPWDVEETFADSSERLFRPELPAVRRFLEHPPFTALYYEELDRLRRGAFSRYEVKPRFAPARAMYAPADSFAVIDALDAFVTRRLGFFATMVAPSLEAGAVSRAGAGDVIVAAGATWRFFRGRRQPAGAALDWTRAEYDDSTWELGPSGFGIGDDDDATLLDDLPERYSTVFVRHGFAVEDPGALTRLTLAVDYDDAYVAWLNGVEIARSASAPPIGPIFFDDVATASHEATGTGGEITTGVERVDVSFALASLRPSDNVLALVGLNESLGSRDFSLIPFLLASGDASGGVSGGCGATVWASGSRLALRGLADASTTRAVLVDGVPAEVGFITDGVGPWGLRWAATVDRTPGDDLLLVTAHRDPAALDLPFERLEVAVAPVSSGFRAVFGELPGTTVWSAADGPYRIGAEVVVPAGARLRIEAGTDILCDADAAILVDGTLEVLGDDRQPVRFRSFSCERPWAGIALRATGTGVDAPLHVLSHCEVAGAHAGRGLTGALTIVASRVLVEDCCFHAVEANAIDAVDASLDVVRSRFEDVFEGVHGVDSRVAVEDCSFVRLRGDRDAIDLDGDGDDRSRVERCVFEDGIDDGIDAGACSLDIRDNVLRRFADKAISLEGNGRHGAATLARNVIHDCAAGIAVKDGARVTDAHHLTIVGCREGVTLFATDAVSEGGHATIHSSILWNDSTSIAHDARSSVEISFSDIGASDGDAGRWPGDGNIAADPRFVSILDGDLRLTPASPCIGAGRDESDMGAIAFAGVPGVVFLRADTNESGRVDISDAIATLTFLFLGGPDPACHDRMDANDDGRLDLTDGVFTLEFLFFRGAAPPPPFPAPGRDPSADALSCS